MNNREQRRLEKLLLAILAHRPDQVGLVPDKGGWIGLKALHRALIHELGMSYLRLSNLRSFFALYRPESFELSGEKVRARPELQTQRFGEYPMVKPPERLYGTIRPRALFHVMERGLGSGAPDIHLVLARRKDLAMRMGMSKGPDPLLVTVLAAKANEEGYPFFLVIKELFLTPYVPVDFLLLPPVPRELKRKKEEKEKKALSKTKKDVRTDSEKKKLPPGSFTLKTEHLTSLLPDAFWDSEKEKRKRRYQKRKKKKNR